MRIIDKNVDYYDYLQNIYPDNSLVFDRRDSFELTKQMLCSYLRTYKYYSWIDKKFIYHNDNFALLQICNTFWLFFVNILNADEYDRATEYTLDLIITWKNYNKQRKLINLDIINFNKYTSKRIQTILANKDNQKEIDTLVHAVDTNDYRIWRTVNSHTVYVGNGSKKDKHIPLFKSCGIANLIDPLNIYLSLEEYFSLEKLSSERREPIGTTDIDKVESHGFDVKTSFRGKNDTAS